MTIVNQVKVVDSRQKKRTKMSDDKINQQTYAPETHEKKTFAEFYGTLSGTSLEQQALEKYGITSERLHSIMLGARLEPAEYEALGRCDYTKLPLSVIRKERKDMQEALDDLPVIGEMTPEENRLIMGLSMGDWTNIDKHLTEPSKTVLPFCDIRPKRLLQAFDVGYTTPSNPTFMKITCWALRYKWGWVRYMTTLLYVTFSSNGVGPVELMYHLSNGAAALTGSDWIAYAKRVQNIFKVKGILLTTEDVLTPSEIASCCYWTHSYGRELLFTDQDISDEVAIRTVVHVEDYKSTPEIKEDFHSWYVKFFSQRMRSTLEPTVSETWEEFVSNLFVRLPGGGTSLGEDKILDAHLTVGDLPEGKRRLQGNKRVVTEFEGVPSLEEMKDFVAMVVTMFLKIEIAKNRAIYPASREMCLVGMYILKSIEDAFCSVNGIDLGHDTKSQVAVFIDFVKLASGSMAKFNADGVHFNEHHSRKDLYALLEMSKNLVTPNSAQANSDFTKACDLYMQMIGEKSAIIDKDLGPLKVPHTLYSGEALTQIQNTGLIEATSTVASLTLCARGLSYNVVKANKGDDLNGATDNVVSSCLLLDILSQEVGVELNKTKDHIWLSAIEHERCIVDKDGYHGSLMRKLGGIIREPQGTSNLDIMEFVTHANEMRMTVMLRGLLEEGAEVLFRAYLLTYCNTDVMPDGMISAMGQSLHAHGFSCWMDAPDSASHKKLSTIMVKSAIREDSKLSGFGGAHLSDPIIARVVEDRGVEIKELQEARDNLVKSVLLGAAPSTMFRKYQKRNLQQILDSVKTVRRSTRREYNWLQASSEVMCEEWARELTVALRDSAVMRNLVIVTPKEVILHAISRAGLVNEDIAKVALNAKEKEDLYLALTKGHILEDAEANIAAAVWKIRENDDYAVYHRIQISLFAGNYSLCFWRKSLPISNLIKSLVSDFVINRLVGNWDRFRLARTGEKNWHVIMQLKINMACKFVFERCYDDLVKYMY